MSHEIADAAQAESDEFGRRSELWKKNRKVAGFLMLSALAYPSLYFLNNNFDLESIDENFTEFSIGAVLTVISLLGGLLWRSQSKFFEKHNAEMSAKQAKHAQKMRPKH